MSNISPTIVTAKLDDQQLKNSVDEMVRHFNESLAGMVAKTQSTVQSIQNELNKIGKTKFDANESSDSGASKRTKAQDKVTEAIERTVAAQDKQVKKNQEVATSFDNFAKAQQVAVQSQSMSRNSIEILNNLRAQLQFIESEKAKAAKNFGSLFAMPYDQQADAIRAKIREITQGVSVANSEQKQVAISVQQTTKATEQQIQTAQRYTSILREQQSELERLKLQKQSLLKTEGASTKPNDETSKRIERLNQQLEEAKTRFQGLKSLSVISIDSSTRRDFTEGIIAEAKRLKSTLDMSKMSLEEMLKLPSTGNEKLDKHIESVRRLMGAWNSEPIKLAEERIISIKREIDSLTSKKGAERTDTNNSQRIAQIDSQIAAKEKEIAETKEKIASITQQTINSTNANIASAQRYTEEIRKQADAIRQTRKWKEQGWANINGNIYYDPERSTASTKEAKIRGSLEEQILRTVEKRQQNEELLLAAQRQEEANARAAAEQEARRAAAEQERLGTIRQITVEQEKQKKKYTSPTTTTYTAPTTDMLRKFIASKAGVEVKDVKIFDETAASASKLQSALKKVQTAYSNMSAEERNSPFGQALIRRFQELQREAQKTQRQLSRPVSLKDALGGSEKTLDDIAYKMQRLRAYKQGIDLTKPNAANEIRQVDEALVKLQKDADKWMSKSQEMIKGNTALGRSWNYMKNRLAFYFTVGASTSFVKSLIEIRGQYELLDRSIGILIDSAQNGSQIFAELNAMAIKSPFTTMELGAAAKQLVAYDVAAKDVVDTTRRLADMAAAVGIPIERLTYALGQIKAYGYLNARDARMFANAGIPLVKELADYYTELEGRLVSTADVYDRIKKKAIDYNDVMSVVNKMTDEGGKFFDFQEKAADTLKVRIANLTLAWNNMLNEMGKDNQGMLTEGLKVTKQIFESWRDINNMVVALGLTYGTIKAAQIAYYLWVMRTEKAVGAWSKIINAIDYAFNAKIANVINSLKTSLVGFFTNPAAMLTVAFTALSVALTKAYLDYRDLQAANEEFNKSVAKNAEENIKSIDKFFGDYKKQLESVGSLNSADQTKLWERVQEEIEKTTKNAEKYIEILNKIPEVSKRIEVGESVLEQSKRIHDELKYMAERGMFNVGGGFANDSAAKDLQQYSDAVNELITKYGDLDNAKKEALKVNEITLENGKVIKQYTGEYADFQRTQIEAEKELQNIVSTLDKVNMAEILGSGDVDTQLANVRSFAIAWRDAFLATEKGSKISAEGQALLNSYIDKWIEQQARVNHLIKDENTAAIEANRTAWETFFKFLNTEERKRLDVAIKTNQLGSKSVQELWDNAAERMQEKATTSYNLIQQQIADLRNTPDVVINVVYRNNKEVLEKDQERFEERYIQPKDWSILSTDEYLKQEKANREKYGTLMRKKGEDTAEYEKRISDERKKNLELSEKNGKIIEENKNKTSEYSIAVTKLADKEKKAADDRLKVIKEIEKDSGYDFSTKKENAAARKEQSKAEKEVSDAFKNELSVLKDMQSGYDKLRKSGVDNITAIDLASKGYEDTLNRVNATLAKYGISKFNAKDFLGKDVNAVLRRLQQQRDEAMASGKLRTGTLRELDVEIKKLNVDAKTYNMDKITKGLNSELGKLKDEYELSVELDANPELGDIFANVFNIDKSKLPKDVHEYIQSLQDAADHAVQDAVSLNEKSIMEPFDILSGDIKTWAEQNGQEINSKLVKGLEAAQKSARDAWEKDAKDTMNRWDKLLEKYAEYEYKVAAIRKEAERERQLIQKRGGDANLLDAVNNREKQEIARLDFEEFMKTPTWVSATGDLANMSEEAIGILIKRLEEYKKSAKYLNPKQIKQINSALKSLYKEQRKGNPFKAISNMLAEAKSRADSYNESIEKIEKELEELEEKKEGIGITDDEESKIDELREKYAKLIEEQKNIGKIDAKDWVAAINETIGAVQQAIGVFDDLAKAIGNVSGDSDADKTFSILEKVGSTAATGAAIGGGWGAVVGAVVGAATGVVNSIVSSEKTRMEELRAYHESVMAELERGYEDLSREIEKSYGTATMGAREAAIANKKLQLEELERQLALESGRSSKSKDSEKIEELKNKIHDLKNEIEDASNEIVSDILGIESVGDFAETLVSKMIEAFKKGEDYMKEFSSSFDELIDNMIMKTIVSSVIGERFQQMFESLKAKLKPLYSVNNNFGVAVETNSMIKELEEKLKVVQKATDANWSDVKRHLGLHGMGNTREEVAKSITDLINNIKQQQTIDTPKAMVDVIKDSKSEIEEWKSGVQEEFEAWMALFDITYGQDATNKLSALQQGIQGITEDTAGALEAYMNGVSQQVYLQSDLLTQIRDAVVGLNMDVQLATQAQILLQLQQSYAVQMAIQGILAGVLNPSGRAFVVELNS